MIAALHRIDSNCGLRVARLALPNWRSPQARGLVAWWPLSYCTGDTAPEMVSAGHGAAGDIGPLSKHLRWQVDAAFGFVPQFDGTYVICVPDGRFPRGSSPRTISLWVNYTEPPIACVRAALTYGATADTHLVLIGTGDITPWQPPGCLGVSVWNTHLVSSAAYNDGQWHHVAATLDAAAWSLYVDGELENVKTLAQMPTDTFLTACGFLGGLSYATYMPLWRGLIRDARIYDRALSAAEIRSLYDPATRFDLWLPRRWWLVAPPPAPPPPPPPQLSILLGQAQIYMTGQESGQCQHAGAVAGEVK